SKAREGNRAIDFDLGIASDTKSVRSRLNRQLRSVCLFTFRPNCHERRTTQSMAKEAKTSSTADGETPSFDQVLSRLLHRTVSPAKSRNKCLTPFCVFCVNR